MRFDFWRWLAAQLAEERAGAAQSFARQCQNGVDAALVPAADVGRCCELGFDLGAGEGFAGAAAHMGLAFLDDAAVGEAGADVAGEGAGVGVGGVDLVADLGRRGP